MFVRKTMSAGIRLSGKCSVDPIGHGKKDLEQLGEGVGPCDWGGMQSAITCSVTSLGKSFASISAVVCTQSNVNDTATNHVPR